MKLSLIIMAPLYRHYLALLSHIGQLHNSLGTVSIKREDLLKELRIICSMHIRFFYEPSFRCFPFFVAPIFVKENKK